MNDTDSYNTFYHEKTASVKVEIEEKLGFKPQKTIVYNRLLPYSDRLLTEAGETLAEIKANLGCAILRRELRPGVSQLRIPRIYRCCTMGTISLNVVL